MPLIQSTSKKALDKNIGTEIDSGRDPKQAIAIAYSIMRKAKAKKMNEGGIVDDEIEDVSLDPLLDHIKEALFDSEDLMEPEEETEKDDLSSRNSFLKSYLLSRSMKRR